MTAEILTEQSKTSAQTFDAGTSRDGMLHFVSGLPEGFVTPLQEEPKAVEHVLIEDRPEHMHMFPPNGLHVPGVPRYESGFRNWYDVSSGKK